VDTISSGEPDESTVEGPGSFAVRPEVQVDALSRVLTLARVRGTVFSRASLSAPWGVSTRGASSAIFHVVSRGSGWVSVDGQPHQPVRAGDLVLVTRGSPHVLCDEPGSRVVPLRSLPTETGAGLPRVVQPGSGPRTEILCGTLELGPAGQRWLVPLLPDLIVVRGQSGPTASFLDATLRMLEHEVALDGPGAPLVIERLSDVLLVQVLRTWLAEEPQAGRGWLAALGDPHLARLVARVHAEPAHDWSAAEMARCAGLSRTLLYERFEAVVGAAPSEWLTEWRMTVAAEVLRESDDGLATVGSSVGYASEAAFCRAFRRTFGVTPTEWRRREARQAS
jgi:AraC-like DNA-binding protein